MITKPRFSLMTATVLMVFVFSAMWTVPAFADDTTPPPTEIPTEVTPPVEEEIVEVATAEPIVVVEDSAATEEPVVAVVLDETTPVEPVALTEVLEQLPEGTDVQVVDENGETLPLATQEAADTVATADPIWCPTGIAPKASTGGCSPSFITFSDLLVWLHTNDPGKAGTIWIEKLYNSSTADSVSGVDDIGVTSFVLDGSGGVDPLINMANFALTIKGGWVGGVTGSTVIDQNDPSVFAGASLSIINWQGNITISDILITDAVSNTNTGDNTFALLVETNKNIQLDRVTVKGSENVGVGTDAMTGAKLKNSNSTISSTVIVNNSTFEDNEGDGLLIQSAGIVTITTLFADGNDANGVVIDNTFNLSLTAPDKAVTLKGSLEFHNNGEAGLKVNSKGLITISNVNASENGSTGVDLDNSTSKTLLGVTINGANNFISNAIGLNVLTHGAITANNINASNNGGTGAVLDNCHATTPEGFCRGLIAKTVKLTGYNYFNNNDNNGLVIYSFGIITVNNVMASDNAVTGAILDNEKINNALPVHMEGISTISLTGYGTFNDNGGNGLEVKSHDNVSLTNLTANGNDGNGVSVHVDKVLPTVRRVGTSNVTYTIANLTITGFNNFAGNNLDGLNVSADGKVTVSNITASFNLGDGADLSTTDVGYGVTLSGTNTFMDNGATGLRVDATGAVTASNVTSSYNQTGASLNNQFNVLKRYNVALTGTNSFNHNDADGLLVDSYGTITVNNLTASSNGLVAAGNGATLDNCNSADPTIPLSNPCAATAAYAVTLTGYVNANNNYYRGLQIYSLGAVTLSNVVANGNLTGVGLHIVNKFNPTFNKAIVRGVTLKGTNIFNGNKSTGLVVLSYGAITLNNINAHYNGDSTPGTTSGVYLNNEINTGVTAKNITITGVNSFVGNFLWGLEFHSNGVATLSRISANLNDAGPGNAFTGGGILGTAKTITLTCGHMFGNGVNDPAVGYNLAATGVLTIKGIYSGGNGGVDTSTGPSVVITKSCALP